MILTDGCGFMNGAALTLIARHLGLPGRPTAVQGRVAGSKGLWMLHPEHRSATDLPRIWIRHSQRKVRLPSLGKHSAHVIFDLVAQSNNITVPSRLNRQLTINLAENGVSAQVFEELLRDGLMEIYTSLTQWDGAGAMPLLWSNVNNLGGVSRSRLQKVARGLARAIGLAKRFDMDREDAEDDDDDDDDDDSEAEAEVRSLHQTVLDLIQAGFKPQNSPLLYEKMRKVLELAMDRFLKKYHIEVPQSAEAFIVPGVFRVFVYPKFSTSCDFHRPSRSSRGRADPIQITTEVKRPINGDECVLRSWASTRMSSTLWLTLPPPFNFFSGQSKSHDDYVGHPKGKAMFLCLGLLPSVLLGRGDRTRTIGRLYQCGGVSDQRIPITSQLARRWWFVLSF